MSDRCQTWGAYTGRRCELQQGHSGGHRLEVITEPLTHDNTAQPAPGLDVDLLRQALYDQPHWKITLDSLSLDAFVGYVARRYARLRGGE
jgi:hypothetical protein